MITRLHSALIDVADLDTATRDYARMLGVPPLRRERGQTSGTRSAFFGLANMSLELRQAASSGSGSGSGSGEGEREGEGEVKGKGDGEAKPRLGVAGLRFFWEGDDPVASLEARGVGITAGEARLGASEAGASDRTFTGYALDRSASRGIPIELIRAEAPALSASPAEPSDIDPAARIRSLDHVVVMSADAEATRDFYLEGLGLRLALDKTFDKRGVRLLFFRVGGTTIEIGARIGVDPKPDAKDGFGGLAWQVPDIDAIQARLSADRFDVSEIRTGNKPGTRVCTVRDPVHGVPTLLIEPVGAGESASHEG